MTTLIRIEHPESGNGIWRHFDKQGHRTCLNLSNYDEFEDRHRSFATLRSELNSIFAMDYLDMLVYFCGFKSIEQLQQWVYQSEINEFVSFGFRIYKIEVNNCLMGDYQVFFKKDNIVSKIDITDIFK